MAFSMVPPTGSIARSLERQAALRREMTTSDPLERYQLRTARINQEMDEFGAELVRQARANEKIYQAIVKSGETFLMTH